MKRILIIATLDTKGHEALYLKESIQRKGKTALVLDCGMGGKPVGAKADITREYIADAGGSTYACVSALDRQQAESVMVRGVKTTVKRLYQEGQFDGVLALGGSDGTILATAGMRQLPLGFPKLVISAMACGNVRFGEYVGTRDITIMPSGTDILGVNPVTKTIFDNAVGAICGMVDENASVDISANNLIAVTMFGQTTPCAMFGKQMLAEKGYELVAFHPNGVGGVLMEEMAESGHFAAIWDLTLQEVTDHVVSKPPTEDLLRLCPGNKSVPRVIAPGCVDFIWGSPEQEERFAGRTCHIFNSSVLLGKLTRQEMYKVAGVLVDRINYLSGDVTVQLPLRGLSKYDKEGYPLYSPDLDRLLFDVLKNGIRPEIKIIEVDAHINDIEFSRSCVSALLTYLKSPVTSR